MSNFTNRLTDLRESLEAERERIDSIEELLGRKIDREPGLWEYTYIELERELWKRFFQADDENEKLVAEVKKPGGEFFGRLEMIHRKITGYVKKLLGHQVSFNKEIIPVLQSVILNLQKLKDRISTLEERVRRIEIEQADMDEDIQYIADELAGGKEKGDE